jgi:hypothetical protein
MPFNDTNRRNLADKIGQRGRRRIADQKAHD